MTNTTIRQCRRGSSTLLTAIALTSAIFYGPSHAATINACVGPNGDLRVIDTAKKAEGCRHNEKPLSWSTTGEQGKNGVSGYEIVQESFDHTFTSPGSRALERTVECPAGKRVLSGGGTGFWIVGNITQGVVVVSNQLVSSSSVGELSVLVLKPDGSLFAVGERTTGVVQAVCAIAL